MKDVVISGTAKSRQSDDQDYPRSPPEPKTCYQQIDHEELKQYECEPVTAFQGAQLMEELWRGSQKQEEDQGGQQLDHRLMTNHFPERPFGDRLEQPAANHEETGQTKEVENTVEPHQRTIHAKIADMGINHENHRESPHCINIFYPLFLHILCKITKKIPQFVFFFVILQHEPNQLDRLGQNARRFECCVLPPATIAGVVLLSISAGVDDGRLHFYFWLLEERQRE